MSGRTGGISAEEAALTAESYTLDDVLKLTDQLASEVLDLRLNGRTVPPQKTVPLIDVARLLRASQIQWPMSLSMAIDFLQQDFLSTPALPKPPLQLAGNFDSVDFYRASGWAFNPDAQDKPVELDILVNDRCVATITSDSMRPDLAAAGYGSGRHGFNFEFNPRLPLELAHTVTVRRVGDGAVLGQHHLPAQGRGSLRFEGGI